MRNQRHEAARRLLSIEKLDALIVTTPHNRRYLTGFTAEDHGPDEIGGVVLVDGEHVELLVGANELEWARSEAIGVEVRPGSRQWTKAVAERAEQRGWNRVGFEDYGVIVSDFERLEANQPSLKLIPLGGKVDALRERKDTTEITTLRQAFAITDDVFAMAQGWLDQGVTEIELARLIEQAMRDAGAEGPAFGTIVASGPHAARPHHRNTERRPESGEPVIIDMGAKVDGYAADLTRTIWVGEPSPKLRDVYNAVLAAQDVAFAAIAPGASGAAIDQAVRDKTAEAGYAEGVLHSVGHGVGLRVHEAPSLSIHSDKTLESGHVVTVEPGIYLPGWGGVRIEDVVLITKSGYELLTHAPKASMSANI